MDKVNEADILAGKAADYEEKPLTPMRIAVGERMSESLRVAPQATLSTRADMTGMLALKDRCASCGYKVTLTHLFVKVASLALLKNPIINSAIHDGKVREYKVTNIGVVVGREGAVYAPVIRNVERKTIREISQDLKEMVQKIDENCITLEDMSGGTCTITNLGMFDIDVFTPMLLPPESAMLGIGATRREVVVDDNGDIVIKPLTTLNITVDHALIDGMPAAKFLATLKEIMQNPEQYLNIE